MKPDRCFLCTPDPDLIVASEGSAFAMVGYGPITPTYCIISSRRHSRSLADLAMEDRESVNDILTIKTSLSRSRGPLLMTEHGRVPVCREEGEQHEQHCFHAHALIFQAPTIEDEAATYYAAQNSFDSLFPALAHAATTDHYLLISQSEQKYVVLSSPLNAPRQLARSLVAIKSSIPELADWRASPRISEALARAAILRTELKAEK